MSNPEGITSQEAYELASQDLATGQAEVGATAVAYQLEIDLSAEPSDHRADFRVVRGQEISSRFSSDCATRLTDASTETIIEQLVLIEPIPTESEPSSD